MEASSKACGRDFQSKKTSHVRVDDSRQRKFNVRATSFFPLQKGDPRVYAHISFASKSPQSLNALTQCMDHHLLHAPSHVSHPIHPHFKKLHSLCIHSLRKLPCQTYLLLIISSQHMLSFLGHHVLLTPPFETRSMLCTSLITNLEATFGSHHHCLSLTNASSTEVESFSHILASFCYIHTQISPSSNPPHPLQLSYNLHRTLFPKNVCDFHSLKDSTSPF